jgi:lysozyme
VGEGNLTSSTVAKDFNQKQYDAGCDQLLSWVYAKKKKLKGLEERRKLERQMCLGQTELSNVNIN